MEYIAIYNGKIATLKRAIKFSSCIMEYIAIYNEKLATLKRAI